MNIILLGPQGSGKGTQATLLSGKMQLPKISTGDLLREIAQGKTPLGEKIKSYQSKGLLVPDGIVIEVIKGRIQRKDCKNGFILEGFPRTLMQAEHLGKITAIDKVVLLKISDAEAVSRLSTRRQCKKCNAIYSLNNIEGNKCAKCGSDLYQREDDKPGAIKKRLQLYKKETEPLIKYYGKRIVEIDGSKPVENVLNDILKKLGA
ncbi:MAG: adenylate kinase [Candidatus Aenigmarchaeota archaeon]|nr:adenylate kinase [Candidatus Aenigmarchaeota archaeon]